MPTSTPPTETAGTVHAPEHLPGPGRATHTPVPPSSPMIHFRSVDDASDELLPRKEITR